MTKADETMNAVRSMQKWELDDFIEQLSDAYAFDEVLRQKDRLVDMIEERDNTITELRMKLQDISEAIESIQDALGE